ncbi:unnamed protein product [Rotaria socialis]|uniref:Uncharacterized protein n=1 Tax=Rotaria socialis TaxID=392032 RepID=A0A820LS05_9BILA|nr:unnamed protein product [Rotaria socialis]
MIRSASHGVAKICDSCTYSSDDCIANAMSIVICTTDSAQCEIFARKKRLSECNDKYNDNVHIEYDCVPISMTDGKKEYTICQNSTDITSDYGIIRSPGYSRQFQITATIVECFRSINVPSNKAIRLWLTDRYIGSTPEDCTQGHVDVVDSIRTRVANLDQSKNDACLNLDGTITSLPSEISIRQYQATTAPVYATLGIASSIRIF